VGIDVGARRFHGVAIDSRGRVTDCWAAADIDDAVARTAGAAQIAVDAPGNPSTTCHLDTRLPPKFRTARCGEIALALDFKVWVPWVTPLVGEPHPGWMARGFALFTALRAIGAAPMEVFPYAVFHRLSGSRPPRKTTPAGRSARASLLMANGVAGASETWSHDELDAGAAALVAHHRAQGLAVAATCGHDGSAIWLPAM
jgi:predicted nuclease with RNAse H fold